MHLSKVAELTNISPRMIRYYEEYGLISPRRAENNYRNYSNHDIEIIRKIKILNDAGIKLKDIELMMPCFDLEQKNFQLCPIVKEKLQNELRQIEQQANLLKQSQKILKAFLKNGKAE